VEPFALGAPTTSVVPDVASALPKLALAPPLEVNSATCVSSAQKPEAGSVHSFTVPPTPAVFDTPPEKIDADHIGIVKPSGRDAAAYTFFSRVYHANPVLDTVETVRDNKFSGLTVTCGRTNANADLQVPIALDSKLHEQVIGAEAELVDQDKIRDVTAPTVTKIDPNGIAHISYSFHGEGRGLGVFGCPTGHAAVVVHFHIRSEVPEVE